MQITSTNCTSSTTTTTSRRAAGASWGTPRGPRFDYILIHLFICLRIVDCVQVITVNGIYDSILFNSVDEPVQAIHAGNAGGAPVSGNQVRSLVDSDLGGFNDIFHAKKS